MFSRKFSLWIALALLAGCESGNGGHTAQSSINNSAGSPPITDNQNVHFEGIWQGIATPDDTMTSSRAIALVNGWGEFRLLTTDAQFIGYPNRTASNFTGGLKGLRSPGTLWSNGTRVSTFTISGSIADDGFIDATYAGSTGSTALAMAWVPGIESTEISAISGLWALFDDNQNIVATFDFSVTSDWEATVSGAHSNGCTYSGEIESWTSFNSYDIWELDISSCPLIAGIDVNGEYAGTAAHIDVADDGTDELALVVAFSNKVNQLTYFLYRP